MLPLQAWASKLRGAESPSVVGVVSGSGVPEAGLRPGLLGLLKVSLKKSLLGNTQTKPNQAKIPGSLDLMSWVVKCTLSSNKSNTT